MDYLDINTLYDNLIVLCNDHEEFFYRDYEMEGVTYRVFDYRLASYTQWIQPGALECRGITFSLTADGEMADCVSRPFEKFFNMNENPMSMDLNMLSVVEVMNKMDGSMIASVITPAAPPGNVWLKSKGALFSDQAMAANSLIRQPEYEDLWNFINLCAMWNSTVIMEYCAPDNRIVLSYDKPQLTVLGVRNIQSGDYMSLDDCVNKYPVLKPFMVENMLNLEGFDWAMFLDTLPSMDGIEGVVVTLETGQRVKIKTDWYCALHHLKDSINFPRRLFEACVRGASDDLKAQFSDDPIAVQMVLDMEDKVREIYNTLMYTVNTFFLTNKHLERKEYAILGQQELPKMHFGLAMNLYLGKEINYEDFMVKHWKDYGIKEDPIEG